MRRRTMKEMGYGQEYRHAHDEANAYAAVGYDSEIAQHAYQTGPDKDLAKPPGH